MTRRLALLIGNAKYEDAGNFPELRTPANDARGLGAILKKHGDFEIHGILVDANVQAIKHAIEALYNKAQRGDLTLLYYSGHGYKGRDNKLYLVARDTRVNSLLTTGVCASFIHDAMNLSYSRHRIVILDNCFSGALIKGRKGGTEPLLLDELKGEGTALLTSSGTIQYSFEEKARYSLFTHYVLEGIETGQADANSDGRITIDELFSYAERKVREDRPEQTPMLELAARESEIVIAHNPRPIKPQTIQEQPSVLAKAQVFSYELTKGTLVADRYRIERGLAHSDTYALYQAFDLPLDREVIIGVRSISRQDRQSIEKFRQGAVSYAAKNHPNLPPIIDFFSSEDRYYVVLEYIETIPDADWGRVIKLLEALL